MKKCIIYCLEDKDLQPYHYVSIEENNKTIDMSAIRFSYNGTMATANLMCEQYNIVSGIDFCHIPELKKDN